MLGSLHPYRRRTANMVRPAVETMVSSRICSFNTASWCALSFSWAERDGLLLEWGGCLELRIDPLG